MRLGMPCASSLAVLLGAGMTAAAPRSAAERRTVESVDAQQPAALALLERAVNINSGTMNFAGVREVGALFRAELEALGFTVRWNDGAAYQRAGQLVAERAGTSAAPLRVLLIGHLDTVFEPDSPFQRFERLESDRARGPGTTDMKGGNVVMLVALRALKDAGLLDRLHVRVYLGGDEEDSGAPLSKSRADLRAAAEGVEVALGFEDGDGNFETAVVARRGSEDWRLTVKGKAAHSSLVLRPDVGAGAIYEAARILDTFRRELAPEVEPATFNPGMIVGGTTLEHPEQARGTAFGKPNVIAQSVIVVGDLRTFSPEQLARTRDRMKEIASRSLPHTSAVIEFAEGYPPMAASPGNLRLLALFDQVSRDLGMGTVAAVDPRQAGAADVSIIAPQVKMAMDGIGLMGSGGHTVNEVADLATLPKQAKRVAVLLARLAGERR